MEQEFKLSVYEVMQDPTPSGRTSEDGSPAGDTIRKLILDNWNKYEKVSVYFDGIMQMTRPFCDEDLIVYERLVIGKDSSVAKEFAKAVIDEVEKITKTK